MDRGEELIAQLKIFTQTYLSMPLKCCNFIFTAFRFQLKHGSLPMNWGNLNVQEDFLVTTTV